MNNDEFEFVSEAALDFETKLLIGTLTNFRGIM